MFSDVRVFTWQEQCLKLKALICTAGYNNVEVCEHLLENGADVNVQDKGGLIPLHNASSYGHVDIAQLLIKYNASVNAVDKWGFTPLHEASQKGRTQLCALLVSVETALKLPYLAMCVFTCAFIK